MAAEAGLRPKAKKPPSSSAAARVSEETTIPTVLTLELAWSRAFGDGSSDSSGEASRSSRSGLALGSSEGIGPTDESPSPTDESPSPTSSSPGDGRATSTPGSVGPEGMASAVGEGCSSLGARPSRSAAGEGPNSGVAVGATGSAGGAGRGRGRRDGRGDAVSGGPPPGGPPPGLSELPSLPEPMGPGSTVGAGDEGTADGSSGMGCRAELGRCECASARSRRSSVSRRRVCGGEARDMAGAGGGGGMGWGR